MNIKMEIAYDGSRYEGWQRQTRTEQTIQGKIEQAFLKVTGEAVDCIGSGRTDGGVHAMAQVANVHVKGSYDLISLKDALNEVLPDDISINKIEIGDERFHSRFSAKSKVYEYAIRISKEKDVFRRKYVWQLGHELDVEAMMAASLHFIGTHDFKSFCGNKKMKKSTVRTIYSIQFSKHHGELRIRFEGDGFLQNMIRILVGTLVEVGEGKRKISSIPKVLEAKDREKAGFTAPPEGLTLVEVKY